MLKNIVNYVLKHPKKISLVVAKHPVGLDETLQDFERSVLKSSNNVKIVAIIGMGGCGKTTLAKEYYNRKIHSFYRCSFVCNLQDASMKNLHKKQKKMFQDLGGSKDISFDNVEEGKAILAEYLRSVLVFIILDDVDHLDQLDSLLPIKDNLKQGSVIVITSRDFGILTSWGIASNSIYKMKELKVEHTMELFCWYAFQHPHPVNEFKYDIKKFLEVCKGLPLSLKVLGALVHGKSKEYWDAQLNKVLSLLPKEIKNIFKVSFDALDEEDKEIFLDISCFFVRTEIHSAITLWDGSGWNGICSLITLVNKCLIEVDWKNYLRMHNQLRDLGKDIAMTWSPYRLWSRHQINYIETEEQKSVLIRGIKAETDEFYVECMELLRGSGRRFKREVEILDVENNYFSEEFAALSPGLVWLRWVNFPNTALQSWIPLKKLRFLELRGACRLEQLWNENANPPVQLRELKLIHAESFLRFPSSIGFLKHLKKISFESNGAPIEDLLEEFCCLQALEYLELSQCHKLKSLPSTFGNLKNLQALYLRECSGIEGLTEEFYSLQSLEYLELSGCEKLTSLPSKFGDLTALRDLCLANCNGLITLPASFKQLTRVQYIEFNECSRLSFPSETLVQFSSLQSLTIYHCGVTKFVIQSACFPSSFSSLTYLILWGCPLSKISVSPQCCPSLQTLFLVESHYLVQIDGLPISLKEVTLWNCANLKSISRNCGLIGLEKLSISDCEELKKIQGLENCWSLEILEAHTWGKMQVIQNLKGMESLKRLELSTACHISAFEPCLQTINTKKWPSECMICCRTTPGVEVISKSFAFPGLTLADSLVQKEDWFGWRHRFLQSPSFNEGAMVCFVLNSASETIFLRFLRGIEIYSSTQVTEGKWVWIGVFTKSSPVGRECPFELMTLSAHCVETGMLVMGEEKRVVDAFYELVRQFGKVGGI